VDKRWITDVHISLSTKSEYLVDNWFKSFIKIIKTPYFTVFEYVNIYKNDIHIYAFSMKK